MTTEPSAHVSEHSDQIQLPLIQVCLGVHLPVVCMVCGQFDNKTIFEDAAKLRTMLDDKTLLVVSSDLTHYGESYGKLCVSMLIMRLSPTRGFRH